MATSSGFRVSCPSCEALVSIKDSSLIGKKVDCPKCKYRFVVEAPEDADEPVKSSKKPVAAAAGAAAGKKVGSKSVGGALDKVNGEAKGKAKPLPRRDDDEEDEAPKKKKSNTMLLVGGGLGAVTLALVACFALGVFDSGDKPSTPSKDQTKVQPRTVDPNATTDPNETTDPNAAEAEANAGEKKDRPSSPLRDITNLLPGDSQFVVAVDGKKFVNTPAGQSIFDSTGGAEPFMKSRMGFGPRDLAKILIAGNMMDGWTFTILQVKNPLTIDKVKAAIDPLAKPTTIKKRDYYPIKNNEISKMLGDYFAQHLEIVRPLGLHFPAPPTGRVLAFTLLDPNTLVVADVPPLERFLRDNARPREQSVMTAPPPADPNDPNAQPMADPNNPGGPMNPGGRGNPMFPQGRPGGVNPGGENQGNEQLFTNIPTYRTVDPSIKAMLNRLDEKNDSVVAVAFRVPDLNKLGSGVMGLVQLGVPGLTFTRPPVLGLCVTRCDPNKFQMVAGIETGKDTESKQLAERVAQAVLPALAREIENALNIPVDIRDPNNPDGNIDPNSPGANPGGNPGGYPMGPGGYPMSPGPGGRVPGPGGPRREGDRDVIPNAESVPLQPGPMPMPRPFPGGPMGPMGPNPNNPNPGNPNDPNAPTRPKSNSFVSMTQTDNLLLINVDLDWKIVYNSRVTPPVRSFVESQRGRVTMLAGRTHWWNLSSGADKMLKSAPVLPRGALARRPDSDRFGLNYPPDQRVSWMVELLPHLGYDQLYRSIDKQKSWSHEFNLLAGEHWVPEFLNPATPSDSWRARLPSLRGRELGATHFVGLSGIGLDSGDYPDAEPHSKKLGLFGWERETKLDDVAKGDGLANTILMIQVSPEMQRPWIRGGGSTVQGVPETNSIRPFVSIQAGKQSFGTHVLMADGSVRYLSPSTDDEAFKALVTYKGGEKVDNLDKVAPKVQQNELRSNPDGSSDGKPTRIAALWPEFFVPEMLGSVKFPEEPTRIVVMTEVEDKNNPNNPNQKKMVPSGDIVYAWRRGNMQMVLKVEKLREGISREGTDADLEKWMGLLTANPSSKPINPKRVTVSGRPGRAFDSEGPDGRFAHQAFYYNRKGIMMEASSARLVPEDVKFFFDSVKVEDPQLGKWQVANLEFGGVKLTAEFPGKPVNSTSLAASNTGDKGWTTLTFPNNVRYSVMFRSAVDYPIEDLDGAAADKVIEEVKAQSKKTDVYEVKRADVGGVEGREFKTRSQNASTLQRVWVLNGTAVTVTVHEPEQVKAPDLKKFWDSVKIGRAGASAPKTDGKGAEPKKGL